MIPALLAQEWKAALLEYIDTVFPFRDEELASAFVRFLSDTDHGLFKGPYLQAHLPYRQAPEGFTSPLTHVQPPFIPYVHQLTAFQRLSSADGEGPRPTLVTTGTGSGKTESFLYPILDHCVRMRESGQPGIKAIILYPMNALAQDQAQRLAGIIAGDPMLRRTLTAGLYIGYGERAQSEGAAQVSRAMTSEHLIEDRQLLRQFPPDILLTNYKMLDLLLQRKSDRSLWADNGPETLRYLVLDELHSYDGVQSADIACLIRRLMARLRCAPGGVCPVGTSATLGDSSQESKQALLTFAETLFGQSFDEQAVVTETRPELSEYLLMLNEDEAPPVLEDLLPLNGEGAQAYALRQVVLWFGQGLSGAELAERLRGHLWFHWLARTATSHPVAWVDLIAGLHKTFGGPDVEQTEVRLQSFLAVLSIAKWEDGRRPLMPVHVQLWVQELRGLVREIGDKPVFTWTRQAESRVGSAQKAALPMVVCRNCGAGGWLSVRTGDHGELSQDPREIISFFARADKRGTSQQERERLIYVYPETEGSPTYESSPYFQSANDATLYANSEKGRIPVHVVTPYPVHVDGRRKKQQLDKKACPYCLEEDALLPVSMRRATIGALLSSHLMGSDHAEDPKLLSFTDSVQDSAFLAGFVQHRARSALLRTGIITWMRAHEDSASLRHLLDDWQPYWRKKLGDDDYIRAFVEQDETEEQIAGRFPRDRSEWTEDTWSRVHRYSSWRVLRELGLHARLGRSLYLTGTAALRPARSLMDRAASLAFHSFREHHPQLDADEGLVERVKGLIYGVILRMILQGGISHPLLDIYRQEGGGSFQLGTKLNPDFDRSPRLPHFYTDGAAREGASSGLDSLQAGSAGWLTQFIKASLAIPDAPEVEIPTRELSFGLFDALRTAGVVDVRYHRSDATYGLTTEALVMATQLELSRVVCTQCHSELTVATGDIEELLPHLHCLTYHCYGPLHEVPRRDQLYYTRLYQESRVLPLTVKEHSSLVPMDDRKSIEVRFSKGTPTPVNMLVCTPTMEMGIDIGDLSSVLLSSVPPRVANRVQRMGRAGRVTGQALIGQIVRESPHDQYFWESPEELLQGQVEAPTCPLDAPEVLKRHLRAYLLDTWIRDRPEADIPLHASRVLAEASTGGFPHLWFAFVDANQDRLWREFSKLFVEQLRPDSLATLASFFNDNRWSQEVESSIAERREDEREAKRHLERLNRRMQDEDFQTQTAGQETDELRELRRALFQARSHAHALAKEPTLEWWTNEGLLPNYTFPERQVTLKRYSRAGGRAAESYTRPQREALRELALGNTFYARGRRTVINQLTLGNRERVLEAWRLCPVCQHMEKSDAAMSASCPRCGSVQWRDQGQQVHMVRLLQVASRATGQGESIDDGQEVRDQMTSQTKLFFDFAGDPSVSLSLQGQVFGCEYFDRVTVRELNFGSGAVERGERLVAGDSVSREGFVICRTCGAASLPNAQGRAEIQHVRGYGCDRVRVRDISQQMVSMGTNERKVADGGQDISVYLYRQTDSEAVRLLLPLSEVLLEQRLANWMAAIHLGLREVLGGSARQLEIATYDEPLEHDASSRARYLVIYDRVPGGTGYLRQLAQPEEMKRLVQTAYQKLQACSCQHHGQVACYKCLLRYERQYQHTILSRRLAMELLQPIANEQGVWERVGRLSAAASQSRPALLESDLEYLVEEKLLSRLQTWDTQGRVTTTKLSGYGQEGYAICIERHGRTHKWQLLRQSPLYQDEVPFATRPDWLLVPGEEAADVKPAAIYCDGAEYHIGRGPYDRVARDVLTREALRRTRQFHVFTLTWSDVRDPYAPFAPADPAENFTGALSAVAARMNVPQAPSAWWRSNALDLLVAYLMDPDEATWHKQAEIIVLAAMGNVLQDVAARTSCELASQAVTHAYVAETSGSYLDIIASKRLQDVRQEAVLQEWHLGAGHSISLILTAANRQGQRLYEGVVRLEDNTTFREQDAFIDGWRAFWHWFHALQWLSDLRFVTASGVSQYRDDWLYLDALYPVAGIKVWTNPVHSSSNLDWIRLVREPLRTLALTIQQAGIPIPEVGFEYTRDGLVTWEAEIAWPDWKICLLYGQQQADREEVLAAGWRVWTLPWDATELEQMDDLRDQWSQLTRGGTEA